MNSVGWLIVGVCELVWYMFVFRLILFDVR